MKKIVNRLKHPDFSTDLLGVVVIYVLIIWVIYFVITLIGLPHNAHRFVIHFTHWLFACVLLTIIICRIRLDLGLDETKKGVKIFDTLFTFPIWISFCVILITAAIVAVGFLGIYLLMFFLKKLGHFLNFLIKYLAIIPCTITALLSKAAVLVTGIRQRNVEGEIPAKGTFLFAYKHAASTDYWQWASDLVFRVWKIVAGTNLKKFPLFNIFLELFSIPIARGSSISLRKMMRKINDCLFKGVSVGIAPESGRFRAENSKGYKYLRDFADTAFIASVKTGVPILPVMYLFAEEGKPPVKEKVPKKWWKYLGKTIYFLKNSQWYNRAIEVWRVVIPPIFPEGEETGLSEDVRVQRLKTKTRNIMIKKTAYWTAVRNGLIDKETGKKIRLSSIN